MHPALNGRVIVFPHCPKTAGSSLNRGLKVLFAEQHVRLVGEKRTMLEAMAPTQRAMLAAVTGHFGYREAKREIVPLLGKEPLYVGTVRDPVDRIRSEYSYVRQGIGPEQSGSQPSSYDQDIGTHLENWLESGGMNLQCRYICGRPNADKAIACVEEHYLGVATSTMVNSLVDSIGAGLSIRRQSKSWWRNLLGMPRPLHVWNSNSKQYPLSTDLEARIRDRNAEDQSLFEWVEANQARLLARTGELLRTHAARVAEPHRREIA